MPKLKTVTYEWDDGLRLALTVEEWESVWTFVENEAEAYQRCLRFIAERDKGRL